MSGMPVMSGRQRSLAPIGQAVHRNKVVSRQGLLERLFSFAFSGLVYPQIWDDPVPDLEALALEPDSHLVPIASGGCNVLAYLTADPARITAVDLYHAHIALNELKLAALRHLPGANDFKRFFQEADSEANLDLYDQFLAPNLSESSRAYWEASSWRGKTHRALLQKSLSLRAAGQMDRPRPCRRQNLWRRSQRPSNLP